MFIHTLPSGDRGCSPFPHPSLRHLQVFAAAGTAIVKKGHKDSMRFDCTKLRFSSVCKMGKLFSFC